MFTVRRSCDFRLTGRDRPEDFVRPHPPDPNPKIEAPEKPGTPNEREPRADRPCGSLRF